MAVREIQRDGAQLSAEIAGVGPPLVLIHGLASDRSAWDEVWLVLVRQRQVVRYDLRGFGRSVDAERRPFRHADDLAAVLDAFEIETADLVGVSMGGAIALNFALDQASRVRRLVLASPAMVAWEWSDSWRAHFAPILAAARAGDLQAARELWLAHPLFETTRAVPAAAVKLRRETQAYSGSHWASGDNEVHQLPDLDRLSELQSPTLLLSGGRDLPDFRLIADLISGAGPDVTRIDYEDAGHMLHYERGDAFLRDLLAFLT